MKGSKNHKKRVEKVKEFTDKNKVFVITMLIATVFLLVNFVFVPKENPKITPVTEEAITETSEETVAVVEAEIERQRETWRFYFIDVVILVAGGGFCLVMILRERRKTKEALK